MPALNTPDIERFTLGNGLNVVLCSAARLKRSAASLRVAAGSHDVPGRWPGLAHFLEHLFFLGTERFAADRNLMRYVQGHGGQINASTRERTTDYFFELPVSAFAGGVERLCDMLAHPRMDAGDQLREREVLHAEFIAWSRDAEARHESALHARLDARHPLRGFHAGNRYSLAVRNPAFQQALKDFYATFYQAGQLTLCLSGPQSLDELRALATTHGKVFRIGEKVAQAAPPALVSGYRQQDESPPAGPCAVDACRSTLARDQARSARKNSRLLRSRSRASALLHAVKTRLHLLFACEQLPGKSDEAVAFLCHWLCSTKPGGLIAELVNRGLATSLQAKPLHHFQGQLLLDVEFQRADPVRQDAIAALFFSWLAFFATRWPERVDEYDRVQHLRLQTCGALDLAHHWCRDLPDSLSEGGATALTTLLTRLSPRSLLEPQTTPCALAQTPNWRLPPPNPFLQTGEPSLAASRKLPTGAFVCRRSAQESGEEAAVFLRWKLRSAQPAMLRLLQNELRDLVDDARQAGVSLSLSAYGRYWQLKGVGIQAPMARVIAHALRTMEHAEVSRLAEYENASGGPPPIPIRQLLTVLPDRFLAGDDLPEAAEPNAVWRDGQWTALAVGLSPANERAISAALTLTPGLPQVAWASPVQSTPGKRWSVQAAESSEDAVLVFCPAPDVSPTTEAAWRLLGHLIQGPFYQRLRVELQLGYAVFSGVRQISGRLGLLFGVQSPTCVAGELMKHIETFIEHLPALIAGVELAEQQRTLIAQFDPRQLANEQLTELLWQAHLSGQGPDYFQLLHQGFASLDISGLLDAARCLACAEAGWLVLSNRAEPLPER
jgi:coenzyme PQQ biosynthesis probable peptidase PqqF